MLKFLLKNKTKKLLRNTNRQKRFINWKDIQRILVVFETNDYEDADLFIEYLKGKGKKVIAFAYRDPKDTYDYSETPYKDYLVSKKEINDWTGESAEEVVRPLRSVEFDLAIDLTFQENAILDYIFASAPAHLKIGYKKTELPLYDISITSLPGNDSEEPHPVKELAKQILYYLNTIN